MCYRGPFPGSTERRQKNGIPFWLYLPPEFKTVSVARPSGRVERAEPPDLGRVYGSLLNSLNLTGKHRSGLRARGLCDEAIDRHAFRSWPATSKERERVAGQLFREYGQMCHSVPGLYTRQGKPNLVGGSGWVLPVWSIEGHVIALRFRSDRKNADPRYYWISSRKHSGPSAGSHPRIAWPGRKMKPDDRSPVVRIVEGEIKAIIVAEHTGVPTLSVPGVASWRKSLPWLKLLGVQKVLLCFDSDFREKPPVARALLSAYRALSGSGYRVALETWEVSDVA